MVRIWVPLIVTDGTSAAWQRPSVFDPRCSSSVDTEFPSPFLRLHLLMQIRMGIPLSRDALPDNGYKPNAAKPPRLALNSAAAAYAKP